MGRSFDLKKTHSNLCSWILSIRKGKITYVRIKKSVFLQKIYVPILNLIFRWTKWTGRAWVGLYIYGFDDIKDLEDDDDWQKRDFLAKDVILHPSKNQSMYLKRGPQPTLYCLSMDLCQLGLFIFTL